MSTQSLTGKTALITGASRGLGKSMAIALASGGGKLALVGRDVQKLNETAEAVRQAGAEARTYPTDVTNEEEVKRLEQQVSSDFGRVQILINNAGVNVRKSITEAELSDWMYVQNTNLTSVFLMCRAFVPHMKDSGYGRILNLTSTMSHVSLPNRVLYSTSKAGLLGLTRALALELAPEGITVVGISPGPFGTEMNTPLMQNPEINAQFISKIPLGRWGRVEEVGKLALFLCSEDAGFITGTDILIDGGWCAQ